MLLEGCQLLKLICSVFVIAPYSFFSVRLSFGQNDPSNNALSLR